MRCTLLVAVCLAASGCLGGKTYIADGSLFRVRWDKNMWNASALTIERFDHKPSSTPHIRHYRWLHGEPPVLPYPGEECAKPPEPEKHGLFGLVRK